MSELENNILFEQLECFQVQRHDFLNNFQVIRGYLQLHMPEKAIEYMNSVVRELEPQKEAYRVPNKHFQALVLGWLFGLRLKGIKSDFIFENNNEGAEANSWLQYAESFYGYTKECLNRILPEENPEDNKAKIRMIAKDKSFICKFDFYKKQELLFSSEFKGS